MFDLFGTTKRRQGRLNDLADQAEEDFDWYWSSGTTSRPKWVQTDNGYVNIDHIVRFAESTSGVNLHLTTGSCYRFAGTLDEFITLIEGRNE